MWKVRSPFPTQESAPASPPSEARRRHQHKGSVSQEPGRRHPRPGQPLLKLLHTYCGKPLFHFINKMYKYAPYAFVYNAQRSQALLLFKYCRKCYFCEGTLLNVNFIKNICFFFCEQLNVCRERRPSFTLWDESLLQFYFRQVRMWNKVVPAIFSHAHRKMLSGRHLLAEHRHTPCLCRHQ